MGKAVLGFGAQIDRYLLMGKHNDVKMGNPQHFLPEDRFPALTVRTATSSMSPIHVVFLKDSIVETTWLSLIDLHDFKSTDSYTEAMKQFDEWKEWVGLSFATPRLFLLEEKTAEQEVSFAAFLGDRHGR